MITTRNTHVFKAVVLAALNLLAACPVLRFGRRKFGGQRTDRAPEQARIERFIARKMTDPDIDVEAVLAHFRLSRTALYRL